MNENFAISLVIPTLNEADNLVPLIERIDATLVPSNILYEIILVDDHSTDATFSIANKLALSYPIRAMVKVGRRGKAYSLLQGFRSAKYPLVAMIDADLQYPPEALAPMYKLLLSNNADVVVTERKSHNTSPLRKLSTTVFNFFFARLLFGIKFDTQSGLKLFRKSILEKFEMTPSPWSFDLEFLVRSLENKYKIISHPIVFAERKAGITKVKLLSATWELAIASLRLRLRTSASKLRSGYQANMRFLEKAKVFPLAVVTLLILAAGLFAQPPKTSAMSLPDVVHTATQALPTILSDFQNPITTPMPPSDQISPTLGSTASSSSQPTSDQTTNPLEMQSDQNPSTPGVTYGTDNTMNTATSYTPISLASDNNHTTTVSNESDIHHAPATGVNASTIYGSTYPSYQLSQKATSTFLKLGRLAIVLGFVALIGGLVYGFKRKRVYAYQKVSKQ